MVDTGDTNASGDSHETKQEKQVFIPIYKNNRYGTCNDGNNCKYSHPPKCLNYCRYRKEGCDKGIKSIISCIRFYAATLYITAFALMKNVP